MNIYVLVEGLRTEPQVYASWIPALNPKLKKVASIADITENCFVIVSGGGYPNYLARVSNAVADLNTITRLDRLVVIADSEEMQYLDKIAEIDAAIVAAGPTKSYRIIVQHVCFETWCLGNRKIRPRNNGSPEVRRYLAHYDVGVLDPELITSPDPEEISRVQLSYKYLKALLLDRGIDYTKRNAKHVANERFLFHLKRRLVETGHLQSLAPLTTAFV